MFRRRVMHWLFGVVALSAFAGRPAWSQETAEYGWVGLRPLPRNEADCKGIHGGPWTDMPTFAEQKGNYPFVAEHLDIVKGWLDGDFRTKRLFFEYYWGLAGRRMSERATHWLTGPIPNQIHR